VYPPLELISGVHSGRAIAFAGVATNDNKEQIRTEISVK
jgi:hypothetical protein